MTTARLKNFVQLFRGGSIPTEIETTDGRRCVLKMRGAGNGPQSLVHEFIVNHILSNAGWPVPAVFPVEIPDDFPWNFGTDEFDEILQRSSGLNLGIQLIDNARQLSVEEVRGMSQDFLERMACADALFCNFDRLEASGNFLIDDHNKSWMIDHGGCLFLIPNIAARPYALAAHHILKAQESKYLSHERVKEICKTDLVYNAVAEVPQPWLDASGLAREMIALAIEQRMSIALAR